MFGFCFGSGICSFLFSFILGNFLFGLEFLILFFLVLLLLLEEGRRPQPLLLLLRAQRGLWIRGTARITLALKRKVENEKINFYSDMDEID